MADKTTLSNQALIIRNETNKNANTAIRVGNMFQAIVDSMLENLGSYEFKITGTAGRFKFDATAGAMMVSNDDGLTYFKIGEALTAADIKTLYEGNLNTNAFTDALLTKLESLDNNFKGRYATEADLKAAIPTAAAGNWAFVSDATPSVYVWDAGLATPAWIDTGSTSTGDMLKSTYDPTSKAVDVYARANHSGTQAIATVTGLQTALDGKSPVDHRHANATTTADGFISAADKTKLDGLSNITIDTALSGTSTNPVQNKVIKLALDDKALKAHNHTIAEVSNLQAELDGKISKTDGNGNVYQLPLKPATTTGPFTLATTADERVISLSGSPSAAVDNTDPRKPIITALPITGGRLTGYLYMASPGNIIFEDAAGNILGRLQKWGTDSVRFYSTFNMNLDAENILRIRGGAAVEISADGDVETNYVKLTAPKVVLTEAYSPTGLNRTFYLPELPTGNYTLATTEEVASGGAAEATTGVYTTTLTFDSIFGKFLDKHTQTAAQSFTIAASGHKKGASIYFEFVADGVNAVNFDTNFDFFYGIASGEVLPAGTYEFYFLYKSNGKVTVNVPAGTSGATAALIASETTVSSGSAGQMTVSWT